MKHAPAILLSIAVGVLLDKLIDVLIPDHVMVFVVTMSALLVGILLVAFALSQRIAGISI